MDATGLVGNKLMDNSSADAAPTWSPYGSRLTFVSSESGNNDVFTVDADGTERTALTGDVSPDWSADPGPLAPLPDPQLGCTVMGTANDDVLRGTPPVGT